MDPEHDALLDDIDRWIEAATDLVDILSDNREQVVRGRDLVSRTVCVPEALGSMATSARYLRMNQALADFEAARFSLRSSLINAALSEGLDGHQLVELFGVPPELTVRFVDELDRHKRG